MIQAVRTNATSCSGFNPAAKCTTFRLMFLGNKTVYKAKRYFKSQTDKMQPATFARDLPKNLKNVHQLCRSGSLSNIFAGKRSIRKR